jgi:chemotaxis protein MotB
MMAFFLLMWLINIITEEQRKGIADYFAPNFMDMSAKMGSAGLMSGMNVAGPNNSDGKSSDSSVTIQSVSSQAEAVKSDPTSSQFTIDFNDKTGGKEADQQNKNDKTAEKDGHDGASVLTERNMKLGLGDKKTNQKQKSEQEDMLKAAHEMHTLIRDSAELKDLTEQVLFEMTPDGLLIQVIDKESKPMFSPGGSAPLPYAQNLFAMIGRKVEKFPNPVVITGHTDYTPSMDTKEYGNWELSADRANTARRILSQFGVETKRIESVVGKASSHLLLKSEPASPSNRRVSILLRRVS